MSLNLFSLMTATQTECPVIGGIQNVTTGGVIQIEDEKIFFLSASSTAFLNLVRGYEGTTAVAHPVGSEVTIVERNIGVLAVPVQTTEIRDAIVPKEGMVIYNDDTDVLNVRTETEWSELINSAEIGQPNGIASLDSFGKVPVSQLPNAIMEFKGTWDASTNTPTLADGTGDAGDTYLVTVAGTQDLGSGPITFDVNQFVIYNGTIWEKAGGTTLVFPLLAPASSVSAPAYSFLAKSNSGIAGQLLSGESVEIIANGIITASFDDTDITAFVPTYWAVDGSDYRLALGFDAASVTTGLFADFPMGDSNSAVGVAVNGFETARFTTSKLQMASGKSLDMAASKITSVANPTLTQDVATKFYVDAADALAATKALDNLASTAVNTDILPGADATRNLGSAAKQWDNIYLNSGVQFLGTGPRIQPLTSTNLDILSYADALSDLRGYLRIGPNDGDNNLIVALNNGSEIEAFAVLSYPGSGSFSPRMQLFLDGGNGDARFNSLQGGFRFTTQSDPVMDIDSGSRQITLYRKMYGVDGDVNNPAYAFVTETGLGWYRSAPGILSVVSGGSEVAAFKPAGLQVTSDVFPSVDGGSNLGTGAKRWGNAVLKDAVYFGAGDFQTKLGWAANTFTFVNTGTDLMTINSIVTNVKTPLKVNNAFILPLIAGTSGQVITSDGAGNSSWATPTVGANTALSNLTSTAINTNLVADSNGTRDIGQATPNRWRNGYINQLFSQGLNYGGPGSAGSPIFTQNGQSTGLFFTGFGNSPLNYTKAGTDRGELATAGINNNFTVAQKIGAVLYPAIDGTAGQVLTTDGAGVASFQSPAAAGANTHLSNLSAVAINTHLLPGTPDVVDIGDGTHQFRDLFMDGNLVLNNVTVSGDLGGPAFITNSDNGVDLGTSSSRWRDIFMGGHIYNGDGDASNPSFSFHDHTDYGMFYTSSFGGALAFTAAGNNSVFLNSGGLSVIGGAYFAVQRDGGENDPSIGLGSTGTVGLTFSQVGDFVDTFRIITAAQHDGFMSSRFTFSWQGMEAIDGTSSHPTYSFLADPTIGMWRTGSGKLSFMHTGTEVMSFNDTQFSIELNQSNLQLDDTTGGSEFARLVSGDYVELYAGYATSSIRQTINGTEVTRLKSDGFHMADNTGYYFISDYGFGPIGLTYNSTDGQMQIVTGSQKMAIQGSGGSGVRLINDSFSLEGLSDITVGISGGSAAFSMLASGGSFAVDMYTAVNEMVFDDTANAIYFKTNNDTQIAGKFDSSSTAGDTRFMLWDVDTNTLQRVTVGAADSGGTGFKVLRIPN